MKRFMKRKFLMLLAGLSVSLFLTSSCLNLDDPEGSFSAEEEQFQRKTYLDNLIKEGYDIDTTANGVYYIILEEGEGEYPKTGDTLTVGYSGYFLNGTKFDSSDWHVPDKLTFILENPPQIAGWDDGMKVIRKNAKVQLVIPSEKAYGSERYYSIPPYQTLVFVIKMFDIKPS
jgi:FKBP-type peptidyl-prolyl cis-trans isomerase FkpA